MRVDIHLREMGKSFMLCSLVMGRSHKESQEESLEFDSLVRQIEALPPSVFRVHRAGVDQKRYRRYMRKQLKAKLGGGA
jgi:hypothetical protein